MDEGVDPTHMCQSLVNKVVQSKQLKAVADPGILALFEAWLDELEEEVTGHLKKHPEAGPLEIATKLGLSKSGAAFLVAKLEREAKI
ncbi:MAG: hypothetical protein A2511_00070 [Deltaproteobacteria bacterium RIFOXYD12_FULL_50_9]|nr:MAG: hypothetical protein A2511_00070 [Deltaproteobacteria bacterium RIFOXYD12_FULL_50_9]